MSDSILPCLSVSTLQIDLVKLRTCCSVNSKSLLSYKYMYCNTGAVMRASGSSKKNIIVIASCWSVFPSLISENGPSASIGAPLLNTVLATGPYPPVPAHGVLPLL